MCYSLIRFEINGVMASTMRYFSLGAPITQMSLARWLPSVWVRRLLVDQPFVLGEAIFMDCTRHSRTN